MKDKGLDQLLKDARKEDPLEKPEPADATS